LDAVIEMEESAGAGDVSARLSIRLDDVDAVGDEAPEAEKRARDYFIGLKTGAIKIIREGATEH
jgi:hypothetical protein